MHDIFDEREIRKANLTFSTREWLLPHKSVSQKNAGFYFLPNAALKTNNQTSGFATKHNCLSSPTLIHFYPVLPPRAAPLPSTGSGSVVGSAWEAALFPPNTLASCGVLLLPGCHSHCACLTHIPAASFHATALRTEIHKD